MIRQQVECAVVLHAFTVPDGPDWTGLPHAASSTAAARVDSASTARGVLRALTPWRGHARSWSPCPALLPAAAAVLAASSVSPAPTPLPRPEVPGHPGGTLAVGDLPARDVDEGSGTLDGVLPRPRLPSSRQGTSALGPAAVNRAGRARTHRPCGGAACSFRGQGGRLGLTALPRRGWCDASLRPPARGAGGIAASTSPGSAAQQVRAAAPGRVTHVGVVAGRPTLSVLHASGVRTTYEPVVAAVGRGDSVEIGTILGHLAAVGSTARARSACTSVPSGDGPTSTHSGFCAAARLILLPLR